MVSLIVDQSTVDYVNPGVSTSADTNQHGRSHPHTSRPHYGAIGVPLVEKPELVPLKHPCKTPQGLIRLAVLLGLSSAKVLKAHALHPYDVRGGRQA